MDGNGRWAKQRNLPRMAGHSAGVEAVRRMISACAKRHIPCLTLYAFSSENWQRPPQEVDHLMELLLTGLKKEVKQLQANNIRVTIIGDRTRLNASLQEWIEKTELMTRHNTGLCLNIAVNYGGRWDITQAMQQMAILLLNGKLTPEQITPETIACFLSLADQPEPDLFIRTSGEQRISNFLLWQIAYTELFFSDKLWPDFSEADLNLALDFFASRKRLFGQSRETAIEPLEMQTA
jgi:undecaprenyl diphosphate synthase